MESLKLEIGDVPSRLLSAVRAVLSVDDGFEIYPFKVSNYNTSVSKPFQLAYNDDALAILVVSTPRMFSTSFKRWLQGRCRGLDPVDFPLAVPNPLEDFMKSEMQRVVQDIEERVDIYHDFDLWPNRKPKILMGTCGHLAGAAYYYRPLDIKDNNPWTDRPVIGVSLHPRYGGYFAFRSVLIFPQVAVSSTFCPPRPLKTLQSDEEIIKVIEAFNFHWQDATFRDCGNPREKYDELQTLYFSVPPSQRWPLLKDWFV